jgi:hypothetical protein
MKNKIKIAGLAVLAFWPLTSFAILDSTETFFERAFGIIDVWVIPLIFALAMLFFFWGIAKYIRSTGTDKEEGKKVMIWGVIALFVMVSVWGLVRLIQNEFEIGDTSNVTIPRFDK